MTTPFAPQTTADTMARIAAGVDPWIAYRDFLEDWTYLPDSQADLMARELPSPMRSSAGGPPCWRHRSALSVPGTA